MAELESFACSGTNKEAFIKALDFIIGINEYDINGFFIDTTGYLVFCEYYPEEIYLKDMIANGYNPH